MALTDIEAGRLADNVFNVVGANKNLIINGAMQVAQRGTQVTGVNGSGFRTVDRFKLNITSLGTWTVDQDTNAPAGFAKSFKATCTTADASPAASDSVLFVHQIEAQNLQLLDFGAAGARDITLSFWVRSNKTGAATLAVLQLDNSNKLVSFQYSISAADTWEQKTITIPGDTAGVINDDNGAGLQFEWWLNSGSDNQAGSHRATWTTFAQGDRNPSNLGVGGATSDYWQITGVQLEVGSVATPFEHRNYGDELARCQRYYYKAQTTRDNQSGFFGTSYNRSTTSSLGVTFFPVQLRTAPTALEQSGTASDYQVAHGTGGTTCTSVPAWFDADTFSARTSFTTGVSLTVGEGATLRSASTDAFLAWSAEL